MYQALVYSLDTLPLVFGANHFRPFLNFYSRMELTENVLRLALPYKPGAKGVKRNVSDHCTDCLRVINNAEILLGQTVTELNVLTTKAEDRIENPVLNEKVPLARR